MTRRRTWIRTARTISTSVPRIVFCLQLNRTKTKGTLHSSSLLSSFLEVHIYDEETGNFYLHHDILLSAYPLSMAWMDCVPQPSTSTTGHRNSPLSLPHSLASGSFVAIGTFHPEIEIWNTDVLDALEPEAVLGGLVAGKRRTLKPGSHRQAVMGLSWNREYRNVLASSSADSTVKLWDVTSQHCMLTLNYHKDKVPVVHFHPVEANILLTASYDRVCAVTDGRSPSNGTWIGIPAKPESAAWDLAAPYCFFVSTERGEAFRFDVRQTAAPLFQQQLHEGPCTALALNPAAPSLCASAGEDGLVRLWSVESAGLRPVAERNVGLGSVFACSFYESAPYLLAACGTSQDLCLWDVREVDALKGVFEAGEEAAAAGEAEKLAFEASEKATGTLNDIGKKKRN